MDDLASVEDVAKFAGTLASDWMLFVEDRSHSIRKTTGLPKRWLDNLPGHMQTFSGTAQPGEFYVFQIGLFAAKAATGPIAVRYENLPGTRCFNLGGTNFLGQPFIKPVRVGKGKVQACGSALMCRRPPPARFKARLSLRRPVSRKPST